MDIKRTYSPEEEKKTSRSYLEVARKAERTSQSRERSSTSSKSRSSSDERTASRNYKESTPPSPRKVPTPITAGNTKRVAPVISGDIIYNDIVLPTVCAMDLNPIDITCLNSVSVYI